MLRVTLVASLGLLAACGPSMTNRAAPVIASPAAQNCITHGGKLVIRQSAAGQKGFCMLTDGRTLDVQEYFRQTNG